MFSLVKIAVIAFLATIAAYMIYDMVEGPVPVVIGKGQATAKSQTSDKIETVATRQLRKGDIIYWQVRTPDGGWLDCEKDCAETYRVQILDYLEALQEDKTIGR